jgi:hypothetical protein
MNLKRGFRRIFVVLAILWLIPVAVLTVVLIPPYREEAVLLLPPIISEKELGKESVLSGGRAKIMPTLTDIPIKTDMIETDIAKFPIEEDVVPEKIIKKPEPIQTEGDNGIYTQAIDIDQIPKEGQTLSPMATSQDVEDILQLSSSRGLSIADAIEYYDLQKHMFALYPNLIHKPPSFWQSEEGKEFLQHTNDKILLKYYIIKITYYSALFVLIGFFLWAIPLALVYLIGLLIWWIAIGFLEHKV